MFQLELWTRQTGVSASLQLSLTDFLKLHQYFTLAHFIPQWTQADLLWTYILNVTFSSLFQLPRFLFTWNVQLQLLSMVQLKICGTKPQSFFRAAKMIKIMPCDWNLKTSHWMDSVLRFIVKTAVLSLHREVVKVFRKGINYAMTPWQTSQFNHVDHAMWLKSLEQLLLLTMWCDCYSMTNIVLKRSTVPKVNGIFSIFLPHLYSMSLYINSLKLYIQTYTKSKISGGM